MAISSDPQGFLVGEVIAGNREMLAGQARSLSVWRDIRRDVSAIARAVGVSTSASSRNSRASNAGGRSAPGRQSAPAAVSTSSRRTSVAVNGRVLPQRDERGRFISAPAQTNGRDSRGRFSPGSGGGGSGNGNSPAPDEDKGGKKRKSTSSGIGNVLRSAALPDNVDPTLNAVKEVSAVISPLGRGLSSLIGRNADRKQDRRDRKKERTQERWFGRIWMALKGRSGSRSAAVGGSGGGGEDGGSGLIGSLAGRALPFLGQILMRVFAPIAALWGAWEVGKWIGEKINDWMNENHVVDRMIEGFDAIKESVASTWNTVATWVQDKWKGATDAFGKVIDSISAIPEKIGALMTSIDASIRKIPIIGDAYAKVMDTAKDVAVQAKAGFSGSPTADAPQGAVANIARALGTAVGKATDWVLGSTSKRFESGRGGAGTVSSGSGDRGGASYGTYQLSSKSGTLSEFLKSSGYASQFAGLTPGSAEFNAKWRQVAASDPAFGNAQHDFIRDTHYSPAMAGLKGAGIDLSGRGAALQDSIWSTSVQFGAGSAKKNNGAIGLVSKALAGKDVSTMSDEEIISAIQDYKAANNASLFAGSDAKTRASTLARALSEKQALLSMGGKTPVAGLSSMPSASLPSSVPSRLPSEPELSDPRPPVGGQDRGRQNIAVQISEPIGQNVGDRGLAHIVTGGIGG